MSQEPPDRPFVLGHASFTPHGEGGNALIDERIVILGEIDSASGQLAIAQLLLMEREDAAKPVTMYVNSPAAALDPALALHDTMQMVSCPVATVCTGVAAEAAVLLVATGAPGQRAALPHSRFVLRMPRAQAAAGDVAAIAEEVAQARQALVELVAATSGQRAEVVRSDLERGRFLTALQALEYGLIDEVLERPPKAWRALISR